MHVVRLVSLLLLALSATSTGNAQTTRPRLTDRERQQGFRDGVILARPRPALAAQAEVAEAREGIRLQARYPGLGNLRAIEVTRGRTVESMIAALQASGRYEFVERDYIRRRHALPNDPRFAAGDQWHLQNTGQNGGLSGADSGAVAAWQIRTDASPTIVAVIDTGIRTTHEDLAANLWVNPREIAGNGRDDDGNGYVDDVHGINTLAPLGSALSGNPQDDFGHGTAVAGAIGAVGNNGRGITGVAWQARIMALKFDDGDGSASVSNLIECIDYAVANGARIINVSFGGFGYSESEYAALQRARDAGVTLVLSAGNAALDNDIYAEYPANYLLDNIVTVASTDRRDALSSFSNYGAGLVELAAPGTDILSTGHANDSDYLVLSGTSFSAPLVAGSLALLRSQFPTEAPRAVINRLLRSVDPLATLSGSVQSGGRLNIGRALASTSNRPLNDDFSARVRLSGPALVLRANNQDATAEAGEPAHAGTAAAATLWWTWTATRSGIATLETIGSPTGSVVAVYTGDSLTNLAPVAGSDSATGGNESRTSFSAVAGTTYQIALGGRNGASGPMVAALGFLPSNDRFSDALPIAGPSERVLGSNTMAGTESGEPSGTAQPPTRTVWYRWNAPTSDTYSVSVFAYGHDAVCTVYVGSELGSLIPVDTASRLEYNEAALIETTRGVTYYIQVGSADGRSGYFDLTIIDALAYPMYLPVSPSPAYSHAADTLFMTDTFGAVISFDFAAGKPETIFLDGTLEVSSPAVGPDGTIYIGDESGYLHALASDLTRRWRTYLGPVRVTSSPGLGADGTIYVHTDDGFLHAYFPNGTLKWRSAVPGESYSAPTIARDGTVYIGSEDEHLYAFSPLDGTLKWKFQADGEIYSSVAIDASGYLYFGTLRGKFYSLAPNGAPRWVYEAAGPISSSAAIDIDDTLYFGCYDGALYAVSPGGTLKWRYQTDDEIRASSPAIAADGTIYIGSYDGFVHGVSRAGLRNRVYATGNYIRSSPLLYDGVLSFGSGDTRTYIAFVGVLPAPSPWPMHRQNARRTGRPASITPPTILGQSGSQTIAGGANATFAVSANGDDPISFQWYQNGSPISGANQSSHTVTNAGTAQAGNYTVVATNALGSKSSQPFILGVTNTAKLIGTGTEFPNIFHAGTGFTYDQILLGGTAASVTADPTQILRISYIDLNDDIVQVEFSGAGTLSLVLDASSGPAAPVKYNQTLGYMRGHAGIVLSGANETTNLSVFSVGRAIPGSNPALYSDSITYDGFADIAFVAITSTDGKFGGLRTANASYFGTKGFTGVYAPNVQFTGPVFVGDIRAESDATPVLVIGSGANTRITGGDLLQPNGRAVQVSGLSQLVFQAGSSSHGSLFPAQNNRARLEKDGVDITAQTVVNP